MTGGDKMRAHEQEQREEQDDQVYHTRAKVAENLRYMSERLTSIGAAVRRAEETVSALRASLLALYRSQM